MNLKLVLRTYSALRQLSDDESALLNILRALNDSDREQLVASMSDKPQKKPGKKGARRSVTTPVKGSDPCASCGVRYDDVIHQNIMQDGYHLFQDLRQRKSSRASGMAAAISNSLELSRKATGLKAAMTFCAKPDCGLNQSSDIHDPAAGYTGYHPFVPPAQSAASPSSPNNAGNSSTASSEDVMGDALDAARAAAGE